MPDTVRNGDIFRQVGKATAVLQVFAVILLLGLAAVFVLIINRYSTLQDGIRENALWSLYQLDRETRKLHEVVHVAMAEGDQTNTMWQSASQHYDILYSRMNIVQQGDFDRTMGGDHDTAPLLAEIDATIKKLEPVFDQINLSGIATHDQLKQVDTELDDLLPKTESILVYANNAVSTDRADARADLLSLQFKSAGLVGLLVVSVGCLIFMLTRQLRSMRAAGISFRAMARDLKRSYLSAEAGNRAKSQFMATMGHEIRTPLNAILGTAELMQLQALPAQVNSGLTTIRRSGETLLQILNEVLDFAKSEDGKLGIELQPTVIEEVARHVVEMLEDRAAENGNRLVVELPEHARYGVVESDPTRLRQVLLNLVSNAIKFTSAGTVTIRVRESLNLGGAKLRFEVIDTGIGIDEEGIEKLYKPFSQVDATISRRFGGTGLGLAISKEIIERLGGEVGVSSKKGIGSTFWFELPVVEAQERPRHHENKVCEALPRLKILLVEDNRINQQVAAGFLKHLGQTVDVAADGYEAVAAATEADYDLVLMDMQMPEMDGIEATLRIRELPGPRGTVPVIAITANASEDDRQRCEGAGMNGFQSKPISVEKLRSIIQSVSPSGNHSAPSSDHSGSAPENEVADAAFEQRRQEMVDALGEDGFIELMDSFFDDAAHLLKALHEALSNGDDEARDRVLHTLKGASSNVGLQRVADACQSIRCGTVSDEDVRAIEVMIGRYKSVQKA